MAACTSRMLLAYSDGLPKHMGPVHMAMSRVKSSSDPKRMCGLQDMLGHREPATWDQHIQDKLGRAPSRWPLLGSSGSRPLHVLTRQGVHGPNTPQCWPVLVRHGGQIRTTTTARWQLHYQPPGVQQPSSRSGRRIECKWRCRGPSALGEVDCL